MGVELKVALGDLTDQDVKAIVTAAYAGLCGGGVDGAVHTTDGPGRHQASLALAPCPAGGAVITAAFALAPVRWVITLSVRSTAPASRGGTC